MFLLDYWDLLSGGALGSLTVGLVSWVAQVPPMHAVWPADAG